jgi:propionyl-CoA carboxylase alpha chain
MAAIAASIDHVMNERKRQITGQLRTQKLVSFTRERSVMLGAARYDVVIDEADGELLVRFEDESGHAHQVSSNWTPGEPVWRGSVDGEAASAQVRPILNGVALAHRGVGVEARVYTRREADLASLMPAKKAADTSKALLCPMPGLVKSISVAEGQDVKAGEALCVVEAMKMENVLRAERDAVVKKVLAKAGDTLAVDAVIMEFG